MSLGLFAKGIWRTSPVRAIAMILVFCAVVQGLVVYLLLQQPWMGLRLEPDPLSGHVRVVAVLDDSPTTGLIPLDTVLTTLQIEGEDNALPLTPALFLSPFFNATYADYQAYLQSQSAIYLALRAGKPITVMSMAGERYPLRAKQSTPWHAIPLGTWFFSLLFITVPVLSTFVWSYQPKKLAPALLLYAGIGYYLFYMIGTLNISKELAFSGVLSEVLAVSEFFFLAVYIFSFTILFSCYPSNIIKKYWLYGFALFLSFFIVNFHFGWVDFYGHNFLIPSFSGFIFALVLSQIQVIKNKHEPASRMAARLMQMSIIFPFFPIMLLYVLPLMLGADPIISIHVVRVLGIAVFIGVTVGILRFRLFDAEYWWLRSWLWLAGGVLVIFIDLLFVSVLHMTQLYSLSLAVLVTGFLYFPLRQWLLGKLMPLESGSVQDFLPTFNQVMKGAISTDEFEQRWQAVLRLRFQPLNLAVLPHPVQVASLAEDGLHMDVPSLSGINGYRLTGKQRGMRLFGKANVKVIAPLLDIARIASNASDIRQQAVLKERTRIMHDLHDTVGAKLLTLTHLLPSPQHKQVAQELLQTLRAMISLTLRTTPLHLDEYLADWRGEVMEVMDFNRVAFAWQVDPRLTGYILSAKQVLSIGDFIRLRLRLILGASSVTSLQVCFSCHSGGIRIVVQWTEGGKTLSLDEYHPNG